MSLCLSTPPPRPRPVLASLMAMFAQHLLGAAPQTGAHFSGTPECSFRGRLTSPGHVAILLNAQASGSCGSPEWARSQEGRGKPPHHGGL